VIVKAALLSIRQKTSAISTRSTEVAIIGMCVCVRVVEATPSQRRPDFQGDSQANNRSRLFRLRLSTILYEREMAGECGTGGFVFFFLKSYPILVVGWRVETIL